MLTWWVLGYLAVGLMLAEGAYSVKKDDPDFGALTYIIILLAWPLVLLGAIMQIT